MINFFKSLFDLIFGAGELSPAKYQEIIYSVDREKAVLKIAVKRFNDNKRFK